jgi:hypothetical protein
MTTFKLTNGFWWLTIKSDSITKVSIIFFILLFLNPIISYAITTNTIQETTNTTTEQVTTTIQKTTSSTTAAPTSTSTPQETSTTTSDPLSTSTAIADTTSTMIEPLNWASEEAATIIVNTLYYTAICNKSTGMCDFYDLQGNKIFANAGNIYAGLWDETYNFRYEQQGVFSVDYLWVDKSDYPVSSYNLTTDGSMVTLIFHQGSSEITFDTTYTFNQDDRKVLVNGKINYLSQQYVTNEIITTGIENDFTETIIDRFELPVFLNDIQNDSMDSTNDWFAADNTIQETTIDDHYIKEGTGSTRLIFTDNGDEIENDVGIYKYFPAADYSDKNWMSFWIYPENDVRFSIFLFSGSEYRRITTKWFTADETWKLVQWKFSNIWSNQTNNFNPNTITGIGIISYDHNSGFIDSPTEVYIDDIRFSETVTNGDPLSRDGVGGWDCSPGNWYVDSTAHNHGNASLKWTNLNLEIALGSESCSQYTTLVDSNANANLPTDISAYDYLAVDVYSDCGCDIGMGIYDGSNSDIIAIDVPANKWSTIKWDFKTYYAGVGCQIDVTNVKMYNLRAFSKEGATNCTVRFANYRLGKFNPNHVLFDSEFHRYLTNGKAVKYSPRIFKMDNKTYIWGDAFGASNIEKMRRNGGSRTIDAYISNIDMHNFISSVDRNNAERSFSDYTVYKEIARSSGESSAGTIVYDFQPFPQQQEVIKLRWPRNFKAAYTITDDDFYLDYSMAYYYGTSNTSSPDYGNRGIVGHNLRTTKNLWSTDIYWNDPVILSFYDELFNDGIEIASHTAGPVADTRVITDPALGRLAQRYGTRHWVDHSNPDNTEDVGRRGAFRLINETVNDGYDGYYVLDLLKQYNFKYVTTGLSYIGTDTINAFANNFLFNWPLPHRTSILDAETGEPIYLYGRTEGTGYPEFISLAGNTWYIQDLIDKNGLAVVYTHSHAGGYSDRINESYELKNDVDTVFALLEDKQNEGTLWIEKASDIFDWMLKSENVVIKAQSGNLFSVKNNNDAAISNITLKDLNNTLNFVKIGEEYQIYVDGSNIVLPKISAHEQKDITIVPGIYNSSLPRLTSIPAHVAVDAATFNAFNNIVSLTFDYQDPCSYAFEACTVAKKDFSSVIENYQHPFLNGTSIITNAGNTVLNFTLGEEVQTFTAVNMAVTPVADPVTLQIETWHTSGDYYKRWNESSINNTSTLHTVGDLNPGNTYRVKIDGNIIQVLAANQSGEISFTYAGLSSNHIFEIEDAGSISTVPTTINTTTTVPVSTTTEPLTTTTTEPATSSSTTTSQGTSSTTSISHSNTRLQVDDYSSYCWLNGDDDYLYGLESPNYVSRMDTSGNISRGKIIYNIPAPSGTGHYRIHTIVPAGIKVPGKGNIVFVVAADDGTTKHYLFKSVDSGINFGNNPPDYNNNNYIFMFGDTDGTVANQISYVRTLENRSFCVADINGTRTLLIGEYNNNSVRVNGSTNDQVRLMKSTDNGDTWTDVIHFNNDGATNQIRHIHTVRQDPYSGNIYIGTGDADNQAGIIVWDGSSSLHSNAYDDFVVRGAQRYRAVDFIFTLDNVLIFSDTASPVAAAGIWKATKDLTTSYQRVNNDGLNYSLHVGWFGLRTSAGTLLFVDSTFGAPDWQLNIYASGDDGNSWKIVGKFGYPQATAGIKDIFERDGKIYISICQAAGKNDYGSTAILSLNGDFTEEAPVIVHPVYWVAPNGVDTVGGGRGYRPSRPWASPKFALEGDKICKGARVIIAPGSYNAGSIRPDWDANPRPGTGDVVIEGAGRDATIIYNTITEPNNYLLYAEQQEGNVIYKNMRLYSQKTAPDDMYIVSTQLNSKINFWDCTLGDNNYEISGILYAAGNILLKRSILELPPLIPTSTIFYNTAANTKINAYYSIFTGGATQIDLSNPNVTAKFYNCDFLNFDNFGIVTRNSANTVPEINNCIFTNYSDNAYAISDFNVLNENDSAINYNCYFGQHTTSNIANNGGSYSLELDPLLMDIAGGDYRLTGLSPCINAGTIIPVLHGLEIPAKDFAGNYVVVGAPDMGAREYQNLIQNTTSIPATDDTDNDGIIDQNDNCPLNANGPVAGTCMPGSDKAGSTCHGDADCVIGCSTNGTCSMNQEDANQNGLGDVCDSSFTTTTVPPVTTTTTIPTTTTTALPTTTTTIPTTTTTAPPTTTTTIIPDADHDGIQDSQDNCSAKANGPLLGTCMPGSDKAGSICHSDADCVIGCSTNGTCSMNQEDVNQNGVGDVCENITTSSSTTTAPVSTTTVEPTTTAPETTTSIEETTTSSSTTSV